MKIVRVFNNNIILVSDEQTGAEKILFGKGVGFQRQHGDKINPKEDDQLFVRDTSPEWIRSFISLSREIPMEYFETTRMIISFAERELNVEFNPFLLISLSDHIYFAVKRAQGHIFDGPAIEDVKRIYASEFLVAQQSLTIIEQQLGIKLGENEAGFIAIHFIENELRTKQPAAQVVDNSVHEDQQIKEIIGMILTSLGLEEASQTINFDRLTTHLRFLLRRIEDNRHFEDTDEDIDINKHLRLRYPKIAETGNQIENYLGQKFNFKLSASENTYLMMHLQQVRKQATHEE